MALMVYLPNGLSASVSTASCAYARWELLRRYLANRAFDG